MSNYLDSASSVLLYRQTDLDFLIDMYTLLFVGTRTKINAMMKLKVDFF